MFIITTVEIKNTFLVSEIFFNSRSLNFDYFEKLSEKIIRKIQISNDQHINSIFKAFKKNYFCSIRDFLKSIILNFESSEMI